MLKRIQTLCDMIEAGHHKVNEARYPMLVSAAQDEGHRSYQEFSVRKLKKYAKIVYFSGHQTFVHLFVDLADGTIYGADGWKKPNFKRCYGTLDTIDEWDWSGFYPVSKTGVNTLVPKDQRKFA